MNLFFKELQTVLRMREGLLGPYIDPTSRTFWGYSVIRMVRSFRTSSEMERMF